MTVAPPPPLGVGTVAGARGAAIVPARGALYRSGQRGGGSEDNGGGAAGDGRGICWVWTQGVTQSRACGLGLVPVLKGG